jgi:hypothetical protein
MPHDTAAPAAVDTRRRPERPAEPEMTADAAEPDHLSANLYTLRIFRDNGCMNGQNDSSDAMSALLSFTARNVRSYREEVHLSLLATRLSDTDAVRDVDTAGASSPVTVLPVAGIFGANASGKSTVLRAMADMRAIVLGSFRQGDHETRIRRFPFLLHDEGACPSHFEVDLILSGVRWQYGFEFDDRHVLGEYAYFYEPFAKFPRQRELGAGQADRG